MHRSRRWILLLATTVVATAPPLGAQNTGTISGRITDRATSQPIGEAQIVIVGTVRGARSADDGTYRLTGVPAGNVQLRVIRLGFSQQTRTVAVTAAGTATADFALEVTATVIDQVVISATGESVRKRENGVGTSLITTELVPAAAVQNLSNVLTSRSAGVTVQTGGGTSGTASRIRIRGSNSINLSNDPLLIVDGVRMNTSTSMASGVGGQQVSRFDDINPDDIESIEIVKGPAASALYGTAAANGVIQITTKRGKAGRTKWTTYGEYGTIEQIADFPSNWTSVGVRPNNTREGFCTLDRQTQGLCTPKPDSILSFNPLETFSPFREGFREQYGLSASGGTDVATYYLASEVEREQGIAEPNRLARVNARSRIAAQLRQNLNTDITWHWLKGKTKLNQNDNNFFGILGGGMLGKPFDCNLQTVVTNADCAAARDSTGRGYLNANLPPWGFYPITARQDVSRMVLGGSMNWQPMAWLRGVGRVGFDYLGRYEQGLTPPNQVFFNQASVEGSRLQNRAELPTYTANVTFTGTRDLPWQLNSNTSVGAQYQREEQHTTQAFGAIILPGTGSLNGASARFSVGETNQSVVTVGAYVEQRLAFRDRLFFSGAVRADDGSTFGNDFGLVYYPSASLSWVISEESFFPKWGWLGQLRVRTAFGKSGQRPGFRQAETFLNPVSVRLDNAEQAAITIGGTGNADLKPEKSEEVEAGFEASMFGGRLGLEFTAYNKETKDALVQQVLAPSLGASNNRFNNLGAVRNRGLEALVTARFIETAKFRWEANISGTLNKNRVLELGEDIPPIVTATTRTQAGYPISGFFGRKIVSAQDLNGDGILSRVNCPTYVGAPANPQIVGGQQCEVVLTDSAEYLGSPIPEQEANFLNTISVGRWLQVNATVAYRDGVRMLNFTHEFRCTSAFTNCREAFDASTPLSEQAAVVARRMGSSAGYIQDAGFWRLREVAVTLNAPHTWSQRLRVETLGLTFAGQNLAVWHDYKGLDPEIATNPSNFGNTDFLTQPPVRRFSARLNFTF